MIKKIFLGITVFNFAAILFFLLFSFSTKPKIAYVDSAKLLNEYKGMQNARKAFQSKASVWKANIDTLANEVQLDVATFEKGKLEMTLKERSLSEELIETKKKRLFDYQQAINAQAKQEDEKMTSEVLDFINSFLKRYGEENGYEMIMAANEYGNIAFADKNLDLTEEVLGKLNSEYSGQ
ncbi:MAG: OmpH family outer membrane protein [Cyclobacteriaceae bacterium]